MSSPPLLHCYCFTLSVLVTLFSAMGSDVAESTDDRRARLQALRAAQELLAAPTPDSTIASLDTNGQQRQPLEQEQEPDGASDTGIKFRNYFPRDSDLQKAKHAPPVIPKFEDPVATDPLQVAGGEDPIVSIAPKKPNWDLRRDVAKKLEKLERRTHRAIVELMIEEEKRRQAEAVDNMEQD